MAKGDVRPTRSNYRGGGWGGGGNNYYDDEGRGASKDIWEWFQENFQDSGYTLEWLIGLEDGEYYSLLKNSVERHRLMDIAYERKPGWFSYGDTRAHRLVIKKLNEAAWLKFHAALVAGYNRHKEFIQKKLHEDAIAWEGRSAAYKAQRDAEQAKLRREDREKLAEVVDITAGMLASELNQAFVGVDKIGTNGDWIDDVVPTYIDGSGFGYEDKKATGVKLQITVSLDLSNSMYYNSIHIPAAIAFRDLALTLKQLKSEYQDDLHVAFFTFSEDDTWEDAGRGKKAMRLHTRRDPIDENDFMELDEYRPSKIDGMYGQGIFSGEDTWLYPLLSEIQKWEQEESDPGAIKLDIIMTDAVLEHPTDIRKCDVIQENRAGSLQSVFLNFMPEKEWLNSTMPRRCFQMKVDKDNIAGILRSILSEFVAVHI